MERLDKRQYSLAEFKTDPAGSGEFSGYASTYNRDAYGDRIIPGAFAQSIKDQRGKIPIFWGHDDGNQVGYSTDLAEDSKGLYIEGKLSLDSTNGANAYALLKTAQDIDFRMGLSIGFIAEEWEVDDDGNRLLKQIDLWETSFTPFPANRSARVASVKSLRHIEQLLRDVGGCSVDKAKKCVALLDPYLSDDSDGATPRGSVRDVPNHRQPINQPTIAKMRAVIKEKLTYASHH